jgi:hypothetical protein
MKDRQERLTIADLYPRLKEAQLQEAEENLERYLELVVRIFERIEADPVAYRQFKSLTASKPRPKMNHQRSNPSANS